MPRPDKKKRQERYDETRGRIREALALANPSATFASPETPDRSSEMLLNTYKNKYPDGAVNIIASQGIEDPSEAANKRWIIQRESEGKTTAKNPKSTAFGLGQLIEANRKAYAQKLGFADPWTVDAAEQSAMMDEYVKDRYGSYKKAREFWEKNGWY